MPYKDGGPIPPSVEWKLVRGRGENAEERVYEQTELSIEGEARMLGMARRCGTLLKEQEFDLDALAVMLESGVLNWGVILDAISIIVENAPSLVADAALILLGIFPTAEDGTPNPEYADHATFMRYTVNTAKFHDMVKVFVGQNDYQRIARPLLSRFLTAAQPPTEPTKEPTPETAQASTEPSTD